MTNECKAGFRSGKTLAEKLSIGLVLGYLDALLIYMKTRAPSTAAPEKLVIQLD